MYQWHEMSCRGILFIFLTLFLSSSLATPPDCSNAVANPNTLWPPNHKFKEISIEGITDPDGDTTNIVINCIMQDEPLNGTGDGNTDIDATGIGESAAQVRKERSGNLNGRFYHINFNAIDSNAESCVGEVLVSVAHHPSSPPVDEGPLYHSTEQIGTCGGAPQNSDPQIISNPITSVQVNTRYTYDVEAFDAENDPLTYTLIEGPSGMGIDSMLGVLSWLPDESNIGNVTVTVSVDDGNGGNAQQSFIVTVLVAPNNDPVITSEPVVTVEANMLYEYDVEAFDADGDLLQYSLSQNPSGMDIDNASGQITWLPNEGDIGSTSVNVNVNDGNASVEQSFQIAVTEPANNNPEITSSPVTITQANTPYEYDVNAVDADGDTLTYSLLNSPDLMSIDTSSGLISWHPSEDDIGDVSITVLVEDDRGGTADQVFTLTVAEQQNNDPRITSTPPTSIQANAPYRYDVDAFDADGDTLEYMLLEAPNGMNIDSNTGVITWHPSEDDIGEVSVVVLVDDGNDGNSEQSFTLSILEPEPSSD